MTTKNPQELPTTGKWLALDVGEKTLGVALSDSRHTLASPRPVIHRTGWEGDKKHLEKFFNEQPITAIVIGLPLTMDARTSKSTDAATSLADLLEKTYNLPILLWDERLTTLQAESALFEQRTGRQKRASKKDIKARVDSTAATLILQNVLDYMNKNNIL